MKKFNKQQEVALEIANELIKTLDDMSPHEADKVVKIQAERLINELVGLKGHIRCNYGCICFREGTNLGGNSCVFVEED